MRGSAKDRVNTIKANPRCIDRETWEKTQKFCQNLAKYHQSATLPSFISKKADSYRLKT